MLDSTVVCRRALGCEWGGGSQRITTARGGGGGGGGCCCCGGGGGWCRGAFCDGGEAEGGLQRPGAGQGHFSPLIPRKMGPIPPQIVYSDLFDCICDVSYLQYIRCI